jgi:hypothetical protein
LALGTITGVNERGTRTYVGVETFNTLEEAIAFQSEVANEAAKSQAKVNSIELTQQSPPTIKWSVMMPATKYNIFGDESLPFRYGEAWSSHTFSRNWTLFGFIFVPTLNVLLLYAIWSGWLDHRWENNQ